MEYISAKTIVTRTKNNWWFGTDYGMNIYRGCVFGCIYCDSRSDCYRVENFDQVYAKQDALRIIRDNLRSKTKRGVIHTGAMSDPYTPVEAGLKLMRNSLELINAFKFGVAVATKSPLVTRDIDVLQDIQRYAPMTVSMTITTADDVLARKIERHSAPSSERFQAIRSLSEAGVYCGVLVMPILPFINDTEENILSIVHQAKAAGAKYVYGDMGVTLRDGQREYFYDKLDKEFPGIKERYIAEYGKRHQANSPHAKKLYKIFAAECEHLGLLYKMADITQDYQKAGFRTDQLSLF